MKKLHYFNVMLLLSTACSPRYAYLLREPMRANKNECFDNGDLFRAHEAFINVAKKEIHPRSMWDVPYYTYSFELFHQAKECEGVYYYGVFLPGYPGKNYVYIPVLKYAYNAHTWDDEDFEKTLADFFEAYPETPWGAA